MEIKDDLINGILSLSKRKEIYVHNSTEESNINHNNDLGIVSSNSDNNDNTIKLITNQSIETYIFLLIFLMFSVTAYYFYNQLKKFKNYINNNPEDERKVDQTKYKIIYNLFVFSLIRGLSCLILFYFISYNEQSLNFLLFSFSYSFFGIVLFSIILFHASFLIEKFYQIKDKKNDIFFTPSLELLNSMIYLIYILVLISCILKEKYLIFNQISEGILAFTSGVLSFFYFYYGIKLANIYSIKNIESDEEFVEKKFIYSKLLGMSISVGFCFSLKTILDSILCSKLLFSNCTVLITIICLLIELIVVWIIGYTKRKIGEENYQTGFDEKNMMFDAANRMESSREAEYNIKQPLLKN